MAGTAQARELGVPNDKGWQHARTGLVLMPVLAGFARDRLSDSGANESDISASYSVADKSSVATIFLFHPGDGDLPMWFDRAHLTMTTNVDIPVGAAMAPVTRFTPPGSSVESGLRMTYALRDRQAGATALAVAPLGEWLVAVRLTSDSMSPAETDATLTKILSAIRWPAARTAERVAEPIMPCESQMSFRKARMIQPDMVQVVLSAGLVLAAQKKEAGKKPDDKPVTYCRQNGALRTYGVYKVVGRTGGYLMALGDAGVVARVSSTKDLMSGGKQVAVTLATHDAIEIFPNFDGLPKPEQVLELVTGYPPVSSVTTGQ